MLKYETKEENNLSNNLSIGQAWQMCMHLYAHTYNYRMRIVFVTHLTHVNACVTHFEAFAVCVMHYQCINMCYACTPNAAKCIAHASSMSMGEKALRMHTMRNVFLVSYLRWAQTYNFAN